MNPDLENLKALRSAALELRNSIVFNIQAGKYGPKQERGLEQYLHVLTAQTDRMTKVLEAKGVHCA